MVDPFFGGWNLFWRQPCIWTLASHKSSRFGHLESYMFVPAGLATCFNGATRRYLELCALPKHLRKKERLRTTSTTLKKSLKLWCFKKNTLKLRKFHKLPLLPQKTDNNYQHISLFELSHWKHAVPGFCWGAFLRGVIRLSTLKQYSRMISLSLYEILMRIREVYLSELFPTIENLGETPNDRRWPSKWQTYAVQNTQEFLGCHLSWTTPICFVCCFLGFKTLIFSRGSSYDDTVAQGRRFGYFDRRFIIFR